jgi:hypothetical protein
MTIKLGWRGDADCRVAAALYAAARRKPLLSSIVVNDSIETASDAASGDLNRLLRLCAMIDEIRD